MKQTFSLRNLFLVVAVITSLLLTACGGGGGGGGGRRDTSSTTTNVRVTIDGSIFPNTSMRAAKDDKIASLTLKTSAYSNGKLQNENVPDRFATKSGSSYVCNVQGLVNGLDYRFSAYHNDKKLMENQISASELQKDAKIPVDIDTSLKTLAYDSWKARKPSNASVENFKKNSESKGLVNAKDYQCFYDPDSYKKSLVKIIKGDENAFLPTFKDINTSIIDVSDKETISEKALISKWYLSLSKNSYIEPDTNDKVPSIEFKKDHTFIRDYSYMGVTSLATGTWNVEYDKLILKYTSGNKKNDEVKVYVENDSLIWPCVTIDEKFNIVLYKDVYKKTKNKKKEYQITGSYTSEGLSSVNTSARVVSGLTSGILIYSESDPSNYADIDTEKRTYIIKNLKPGEHYIVFKHITNNLGGTTYICRTSSPVFLTADNPIQSTEILNAKECTVSISGKIIDIDGKTIVPAPILTLWGQNVEVNALTGEFTTPKMPEDTRADLIINAVNYQKTAYPLVFQNNPSSFVITAVKSSNSNLTTVHDF